MSELDDDTVVTPESDGSWAGVINPRWNVGRAPNGGYLLALVARALLAETGRPDPLTITAHYITPPEAGPVRVEVETVRAGRRYATVAGRVVQGDAERFRVMAALGDLSAFEGPTRVAAEPPSVPPPETIPPLVEVGEGFLRALPEAAHRFDVRIDPDSAWARSRQGRLRPEEPLEVKGWIRLADGSEPSVLALLLFSDAFPPTVTTTLDVGWVPTVELTVHVRGRPAGGWVLGSFRTRFLVDGVLEQDGELWGADGRLLAQSRQLALVLPRRV